MALLMSDVKLEPASSDLRRAPSYIWYCDRPDRTGVLGPIVGVELPTDPNILNSSARKLNARRISAPVRVNRTRRERSCFEGRRGRRKRTICPGAVIRIHNSTRDASPEHAERRPPQIPM